MQVCKKCNIEKPFESFQKEPRVKTGYGRSCNDCERVRKRLSMDKSRKANPQKFKDYKYEWYRRDLNKNRANKANAERRRISKDREGYNAKLKAKYDLDGHKQREASRKRRAKTKTEITKAQWLEILEINDNRCAYCLTKSDKLEVDHIIPLARGGLHEVDNIVPACEICNTSKNDKLLLEIFSPRLLIEQRRTITI